MQKIIRTLIAVTLIASNVMATEEHHENKDDQLNLAEKIIYVAKLEQENDRLGAECSRTSSQLRDLRFRMMNEVSTLQDMISGCARGQYGTIEQLISELPLEQQKFIFKNLQDREEYIKSHIDVHKEALNNFSKECEVLGNALERLSTIEEQIRTSSETDCAAMATPQISLTIDPCDEENIDVPMCEAGACACATSEQRLILKDEIERLDTLIAEAREEINGMSREKDELNRTKGEFEQRIAQNQMMKEYLAKKEEYETLLRSRRGLQTEVEELRNEVAELSYLANDAN